MFAYAAQKSLNLELDLLVVFDNHTLYYFDGLFLKLWILVRIDISMVVTQLESKPLVLK